MKYVKQLDSIRAIAVLLVIVSHWVTSNRYINFAPLGTIGVDIFFTLSGFLITHILLSYRAKEQDRQHIIKSFIIRRGLRIFPLYYLVVFLFSQSLPYIRDHIGVYLTYTTNFHFFATGQVTNNGAHVWSLAVEEQFYLLWPWLMVYCREKYLPVVIASFILVGHSINVLWPGAMMLTPACLNAFAIGALPAWFLVYKPDIYDTFRKSMGVMAVISAVLLVAMLALHVYSLGGRTFVAVISAWWVMWCLQERKSWLMDSRVLIYLGKVSYGLYLFHNFIPAVWVDAQNYLTTRGVRVFMFNYFPSHAMEVYGKLAGMFILLLLITWVSWRLFESPINNLKKYFGYQSNNGRLVRMERALN